MLIMMQNYAMQAQNEAWERASQMGGNQPVAPPFQPQQPFVPDPMQMQMHMGMQMQMPMPMLGSGYPPYSQPGFGTPGNYGMTPLPPAPPSMMGYPQSHFALPPTSTSFSSIGIPSSSSSSSSKFSPHVRHSQQSRMGQQQQQQQH